MSSISSSMDRTLPMTMSVIDFNAHLLQALDFLLHNGLWKTEFRNAVNQYAARCVECLKDGDLVALLGKVASAGQTRRASADDGYLMAV